MEGYTFTVDEEMADYVQEFVDWCEKEPGDQFVEVQVRYNEYMKNGYGRLDDARAKNGLVVITDLKYGKVPVFAENNSQLRIYALGFYLTFGHLYNIEGFKLRISQPRIDYEGEEVITIEQLLEWADRVIRPTEEKLESGVLEFNAGPWCRYCPIKFGCETRQQWILSQIPTLEPVDPATEFENLDEQAAAIVNDPPKFSADMPIERLNLLLQAAPAVIKYFKDIQSYANSLLKVGVEELEQNWKLVPGRNVRYFKVPDAEVVEELQWQGLDDDDIWEPRKIRSPKQLEKKLGKKHSFFTDFVDKKPGKKLTLVPVSDKRPGLNRTQIVEFENLDDEDEE